MLRLVLLAAVALSLASCSNETTTFSSTKGTPGTSQMARTAVALPPASTPVSTIAGLPDYGALLAYDSGTPPIRRSAYTWHAVQVSEAHALAAIAGHDMVLPRPEGGAPIRLRYVRHIEHDNGNWTWIGRPEGAEPGTEAIITFGEKALFGTIPSGSGAPYRLTMEGGQVLLMETDLAKERLLPGANPKVPDALLPPSRPLRRSATSADERPLNGDMVEATHLVSGAISAQNASAGAANTIDVVVGYTSTYASRLGGQSQAVTRLTFLVDLANTALANSVVTGQVRLVKAVQVYYPDATANEQALYDLTGFDCSGSSCVAREIPAALQPLLAARETYGGDLVTLVRKFEEPENGSCGIAWLIGGGMTTMTSSDEYAGMSVVSDSSGTLYNQNGYYCTEDAFVHELGHNMGSAHDRETSAGDDGVLQTEEYGRFSYSFGYKTTPGSNPDFHTVMAYGSSGQQSYLVFSNPRITYCGGLPCGVTDQADNARSLNQTIPIVATFRAMVAKFGDVNGEHWAFDYIRRFGNSGITSGCAAATSTSLALFCPEASVTREQMAVFIVRAQRGIAYTPPAATGMFADVPASSAFAPWIEQLARDGIASGCATNPARYCPTDNVTRDQMAVFLMRARYGPTYVPPDATGMFDDVPTGYWAGGYIERLATDGITGGCSNSPPLYCPGAVLTRAQMAVFIVRAYGL